MSLLRSFGNLLQASVQTAIVLPCAVVKDAVMLGAIMAGDPSSTVKALKTIKEELKDSYEELDR